MVQLNFSAKGQVDSKSKKVEKLKLWHPSLRTFVNKVINIKYIGSLIIIIV